MADSECHVREYRRMHPALTDLDDHGDGCAGLLVPAPGPGGHDCALLHLLLRLLGDEDAALRLGRRLRPLDQHAVEQGQESLQGAGLKRWGNSNGGNCVNGEWGIAELGKIIIIIIGLDQLY